MHKSLQYVHGFIVRGYYFIIAYILKLIVLNFQIYDD